MEILSLVLGQLQTNCYLVHRDGKTLVIDPAADAQRILQTLREKGWTPDAVLLTHGHFDHMLALNDLPVDSVAVHKNDVPMLCNPQDNLSALWSKPYVCTKSVQPLEGGDSFFGMEVLHTPGHTQGSLCLYDWKEKVLFSGDTLFQGGYGRTDFPGGDARALAESVQRVLGLPPESRVLTGHGAETTIQAERRGGLLWQM